MLRRCVLAVFLSCCAALLAAPLGASAAQDLFGEYATLAQEYRTPPPLVPLVLPAAVGGSNATPHYVLTGPKGVFSLTFDHSVQAGTFHRKVDASILLQDLGNRRLAGRLEYLGSNLYKSRKTRVRGKKALLLTARYSPVRSLVWREDGRLFELSTNTPHAISVSTLRAVAAGLQHLRGAYTANVISGDGGSQQAEVLVADRSAWLEVSWTAPCTRAGAPEAPPDRVGTVVLGWLPTGGGGSLSRSNLAVESAAGAAPWTFSVSGAAAGARGGLTIQAASAAGGESCSIGPLELPLAPLPVLRRF